MCPSVSKCFEANDTSRSCKLTIASAKERKPDLIIVTIGTADPDYVLGSGVDRNRTGQDPDSDNHFNGTERRKRCAEWDGEITSAIDTVRGVEDILLIHSTDGRPAGRNIFIAIASFLSALERQGRYLLETQVARQTEIRVEYEMADDDDPNAIN